MSDEQDFVKKIQDLAQFEANQHESELVKRPYTPREMEEKVEGIRKSVTQKMTKWADRLVFSMATTKQIERREGERWEEDGKMWEMKGGVRQTVTKTADARMPWWCPKCSKSMSHKLDRKFYYLRGWCFNCNVAVENEMRLAGTWDAYEKSLLRANEKAFLRDKIEERLAFIKEWKPPTLYFEDGRYEELAPREEFVSMMETVEKDIEFMLRRLEVIAQEEEAEHGTTTTI